MIPRSFLRRLRADRSGMAMVEFALCLPFVVGVAMTGAELTNFTTVKMRMSQLALQVADNASRIGTGTVTTTTTISEAQINDMLTGAGYQSGKLNVYSNGRIIVSSLETDPANTGKYRIRWQRCRGSKVVTSSYGVQGANNLTGITLNGQLITAPTSTAVMIVEISYNYQPIISSAFIPRSTLTETAAMVVRDNRDMTGPTGGVGIYNNENVTASACSIYSNS
jgi:Flp pilus assembly protein TadG